MSQAQGIKQFGFVEFLLLLGCVGAVEIITASIFWEAILHNTSLKLFRPDQLFSKLAVMAMVLGLIGFFNYISGLFIDSLRESKIRNILGISYFIGFLIVAYIKSHS